MSILLVRHARAGRRDRWQGDDRLRPLSKKGLVQARALSDVLVDLAAGGAPRVIASPWVRCIETVGPVSAALGVEVASDDALGEGMGDKAVEALPGWLRAGPTVLCTHGDVIERIVAELARSGVDVGTRPQAAKGSVWVLRGWGGEVASARYLPPPV